MSAKKDKEEANKNAGIAILDFCNPGDVVYCREREGRLGITTTARFESRQERVVIDAESGKEKIVTDYFLWDLRNAKRIVNPTSAWVNIEQYQSLRSAGKIKIAGDFVAEDKKKAEIAKAVATAA
jgi:hypothetical protein